MEGKQVRYSDKDLNEFKAIIEEKLAAAKKELEYARDEIKQLNASDTHTKIGSFESGSATNEREYLNKQASRQTQFIRNLEYALMRIANKSYGVCRETGDLINKERLKLVPHATLSIAAKKSR